MNADSEHQRKPKASVFISYSRKDMAFTDRLEAALRARGFEPLIDRGEVYAFEERYRSQARAETRDLSCKLRKSTFPNLPS